MNTFVISRRGMTARFYAVVTIVSLLLSAFPASFFVAEAAAEGVVLDKASETTTVGVKANFVASTATGESAPAGSVVAVTDGSGGGSFYSGVTNGNCNSDTVDSDNEFSINQNKGVCYSNDTAGVYTIEVQLLDASSTPIGSPASLQMTVEAEQVQEEKKVDICHFNNGNGYVSQSVNVNSLGNGHGESGVNKGDIIPPIPGHEKFENGFNWDWGNLWHENGCEDPHSEPGTHPNPHPDEGELRVCKLIDDGERNVVYGNGLNTDFSVRVQGPDGFDETVVFTTPLDPNVDLVNNNGAADDAKCVIFSEAKPGEYTYEAEVIAGDGDWEAPLYHDFYTGAPSSLSDFFLLTEDGSPEDNDDADGVINVSAGGERTLAIVNTLIPEPELCTVTRTSNDSNLVVEKSYANAVELSFVHSAWTTSLVDAEWIWGDDGPLDPVNGETQTFVNQFGWGGDVVLDATLTIAADNKYEASLNSSVAADDAGYAATQDFDVTSLIQSGNNELSVVVENLAQNNATPESNPAGLYYELVINGEGEECDIPYEPEPEEPEYDDYCGDGVVNQEWEQCDPGHLIGDSDLQKRAFVGCSEQCQYLTEPVCTDLTLAKIDMEVENLGDGDMSTDIYLGQDSLPIPNGAWFMLHWNDVYADDSDVSGYEDVPGLAVERAEGSIRSVMYGSTGAAHEEHVNGSVDIWSWDGSVEATAVLSDDSNGLGKSNRLEGDYTDGSGIDLTNANDDEIWLDNGAAGFWLTTTTADDGFFVEYGEPVECYSCDPNVNLLENGSFEEPLVTNGSKWQKFNSVSNWLIEKVSDDSTTTLELHRDWSSNEAADGAQYAELDGDHSTKVTQSVATVPGETYELSWAFAPRHNIAAEQNQLSVLIEGSVVAVEGPATAAAGLEQDDWTLSSHFFDASDDSTEITFADAGPSNSYGTFLDHVALRCVIDEPPVQGSLEITSPATDGETLSGTHAFQAEYVDEDAVQDTMRWAIRTDSPTCSGGTTYAGGNISGWSDPSTFDGASFEATVDMSTWPEGNYCFVVNPDESDSGDGSEFREFRSFILETDDNNGQEYCDDELALNYGAEEVCRYEEEPRSSSGGGGGSTKPVCRDLVFEDGMLEWDTNRGKEVLITANGVEIFTTTDDEEMDAGSLYVGLAENVIYELTVNRYSKSAVCEVESGFLGGVGGDFPEGLVLGEQVSVVPYGAPDAGAGGAAPLDIPRTITANAIVLRNLLRVANDG